MQVSAELTKLFESCKAIARKRFEETGECMPGIFIFQFPSGKTDVAPVMWDNTEEKHIKIGMARRLFLLGGVQRVVFTIEIWFYSSDNMKDVEDGPAPSEHPNRKEAVMIIGEERGANTSMFATAEIVRPKVGKPRLKPFETMDAYTGLNAFAKGFFGHTGRMLN